jgi:hypothetical protein
LELKYPNLEVVSAQSSLGKKFPDKGPSVVVHAYNPSYKILGWPRKSKRPYAGVVTGKHRALSSNPSTKKKSEILIHATWKNN